MAGANSVGGWVAVMVASAVGPAAMLIIPGVEREMNAVLVVLVVALVAFLAGRWWRNVRFVVSTVVVSVAATAGVGWGVGMTLGERWWILAMLTSFPAFLLISAGFLVLGRALRRTAA